MAEYYYDADPRFHDSAAAKEYDANPDKLGGAVPNPKVGLLKEQPEHRIMILLKAQGLSGKEIALRTGYTPEHIYTVLRQPWARQQLIRELNEGGRPVIETFLMGEVTSSLQTLVEIRDNPQAKNSDRIAAARDLVDRALGKPTQHVESTNRNVTYSPEEIAELDREITDLEVQLKHQLGRN